MKHDKNNKPHKAYSPMGNKGSAMVVVIIAMAFIGILASVLMYTAMLNYQMKVNNLKAKDNFYSAESVLDEIKMGIEKEVSLSIQDAYQLILTNFEDSTSEEKKYRMRYRFLSSLQEKYKAGSDTASYDLTVLFGYLENTYEGTVLETSYGGVEYSVMRAEDGTLVDKYGAELTSADIPRGSMALYTDGLSIKDLKVTYTDDSGYVSIIETDLRIYMPDMEFAEAISLPALTSYSLVAQSRINVAPDSGVSTNTIRGCFYGEGLYVGSATDTAAPASVVLKLSEDENNYNSDKRMVIAEKLYIGQGSSLYTDSYGELWARDIIMNGKSSSGALCEINFGGNDVYVANDLLINGAENVFSAGALLDDGSMEGQYIGFGVSDSADESSSIIINGTDTEIYLNKLSNLTLAGNTYVGISSADSELDGTEGVYNDEDMSDVVMGQSIAVKSDQVAYLIPAECIGVYKDTGERVKESLTNPMTIEDYQTYLQNNSALADEVSADINCSALGGNSLSDYGIVTDSSQPMYQKFFKRINSKITLVYFYVMFDSTSDESLQQANQYFADYYNANKSTMDAYSKLYTRNIEMRDETDGFYTLHLAGNVVRYDSASQLELRESTASADASNAGYQTQLTTYQSKFTALCKKLIDSYEQLSASEREDTSNVYTNLVNTAMFTGYFSNVDADTSILDKSSACYFGESDVKAVIVKGDYTYTGSGDDDFDGIIIATGDVAVNDDFNGTVLCGGSITLGQDVTVQPDKTSVIRALTYSNVVNGYEYNVTDFLIGGSGYLSGSSKTYDSTSIDLGELIVYENWQKQ